MEQRPFGTASDGSEVVEVTLSSDALEVTVISWGAVIRDLRPKSGPMAGRPLVLGLNSIADYEAHSPYFGAIVGRAANRIGAGRAQLNGRDLQLTQNLPDGNHLHGGARGFGQRTWQIAEADERSITLALSSPDGEEGYPGTVEVRATYSLNEATVTTKLFAACDAPTFVNLAQHSYFNLDGSGDVRSHSIQIATDRVTPTDDTLVPTGELAQVAGTPFDFREARPIVRPGEPPTSYDINYCLADAPRPSATHAATLTGAESGVRLDLMTTEPGLQFYDGGMIDVPVPGLDGIAYEVHSGLCLEPQRWPDAPNHDNFPSIVLNPGDTYQQRTEFRFSW